MVLPIRQSRMIKTAILAEIPNLVKARPAICRCIKKNKIGRNRINKIKRIRDMGKKNIGYWTMVGVETRFFTNTATIIMAINPTNTPAIFADLRIFAERI